MIEKLDAEPDQIPMRWFNAIFGRIFLGINRTAWLEDVSRFCSSFLRFPLTTSSCSPPLPIQFIKSKLHKKLHRLALPSFLSPLMVTQVSLSSPPPTFSRPMLKDLSPQGEASMEVFVSYPGELRVSVTTTATLSLGGRFKSYQVPLVLTLIIKEIEGDLRVRVKGPPSNRLWYGFSGEPKMTIVSASLLINVIERLMLTSAPLLLRRSSSLLSVPPRSSGVSFSNPSRSSFVRWYVPHFEPELSFQDHRADPCCSAVPRVSRLAQHG